MRRNMFALHGVSSIHSPTYCTPSVRKARAVATPKMQMSVNFASASSIEFCYLRSIALPFKMLTNAIP